MPEREQGRRREAGVQTVGPAPRARKGNGRAEALLPRAAKFPEASGLQTDPGPALCFQSSDTCHKKQNINIIDTKIQTKTIYLMQNVSESYKTLN